GGIARRTLGRHDAARHAQPGREQQHETNAFHSSLRVGGHGTNPVPLLQRRGVMRLPKSVGRLLTAAYPGALATVLIIFVWQTVAARRAAAPPPPVDDSHEL